MMQKLCKFILSLFGWKVVITVPKFTKSVICIAPHTSNWDFIIGKLAYSAAGLTAHFMIKQEWFFFPFNLIFNAIGGIPVARNKKTRLVDQIVEMFKKRDVFNIGITPEGTRGLNPHWKKGFYQIALKANVPIQLAYMDYETKTMGIEQYFVPSGNEEADFAIINAYYKNVTARNPQNFSLNK